MCKSDYISALVVPGMVTGTVGIPEGNERDLLVAVSERPVSVAVDARFFQSYGGGIMSGEECTKELNHAVLAVGYGDGFWKIKNSWGNEWGEDGFLRLQRGSNICGIANAATYPLMD